MVPAAVFGMMLGSVLDARPHAFEWRSYADARGRAFVSPRWAAGTPGRHEGDFVTLVSAEATIKLAPGWVLKNVRFKVLRPIPEQGFRVWYADPAIDSEARVGDYDELAGGWPVSATDPRTTSPARFAPGLRVYAQWHMWATDPDGKTHELVTDGFPAAENVRFRRRH